MNDYSVSGSGGEGPTVEPGQPEAELEKAIAFLHRVRPVGLIALTAIPPDGGPTHTATFAPGEDDKALRWLKEHSTAGRSLYWTVNPTRERITSKAKKEDIENLDWLHVDIDPADDADPVEAREAALALLRDYKPEHQPTLTLDSGGGIQAFWQIEKPGLYIGCNEAAAEEAECYTRQIETDLAEMLRQDLEQRKEQDHEARPLLRVDSCHDCCRLMRLPGTINQPGEKKRKAGRVPRLASVLERHDDPDHIYGLGEFTPAPARNVDSATGQAKVQLDSAPPPIDLEALPAAVTSRTRMLIVQGDDPNDQHRYASRSEVTFAVCTEMVRARCSNEQIAAVLLDPDYGISRHTLAQNRSLDYAARQIKRARDEVGEDPMLRELNERHAVVELYGGKTKVVSWEPSEVDPSRTEIVAQSFDDFRNRYMNRRVESGQTKEGNPTYTPAGKWWLEHPMRRQYRSVVFRPNEEAGDDEYNIWRGLAVRPEPGEWPLLRRLIVEGLAGGDEALATYIIRWSAFAVQNPGKPAEVALTLIGGKGTGKGTFARVMCRIFGQHARHVAGEKSLTGNFNKHLHGTALLFADEAVAPGDKGAAGLVKAYITEEEIMIEPKGVDSFPVPNRLKAIISSNNTYVVDASDDERRYAVCKVSKKFVAPLGASKDDEQVQFWRKLRAEIENGGTEAFLHELLEMDLGDWHPRYDVPQTTALNEQRAAGLKGFDQIWFDALASGELPSLPSLRDIGGGQFVLPTTQLEEYCRKVSRRTDISKNRIGNLLGEGQPDKDGVIHTPGMGFEKWKGTGPKGWVIPALSEARAAWDGCRWPWQWDGSDGWGFESAVIDDPARAGDRGSPARDDEPY